MKKTKIGTQLIRLAAVFLIAQNLQSCCDCLRTNLRFHPATIRTFPYLEISGNHYQIGYAIGDHFSREIRDSLKRRQAWFSELKRWVDQDKSQTFNSLKAKAEAHFPALIDELTGMSAGSGIPFDDLFLINIKAEIGAKNRALKDPPGCSTITLIQGNQKWLFHNEDGDIAYRDLMFVVKATLPSGVTLLSLCYPGHLMGNGPSMNSHGIIQTTNFIYGLHCRTGIPRYFLGRAVLEAASLEDAVAMVTRQDRAYSYHHNLASTDENRILSIEVTPEHHHIEEPASLYVHTNHLILEGMKSFPQDNEYVRSSSLSRYDVIATALANVSATKPTGNNTVFNILSSHENSPYSPCRHPRGEVRGVTLATAVIDVTRGTMTLYKGNPCRSIPDGSFCVYSLRDLNP